MPEESTKQKSTDRVGIINAVKSYLGFFVLIVLVVEAVLGAVALGTQGSNQLVALYGMLFIVVVLIVVVSFFAYLKPDALLRAIKSRQVQGGQPLQEFSDSVSGHWWEFIKPDETSAISYVELRTDSATNTVKMKGSAYSKTGELSAIWESVASCVNPNERKVFYYWKGWHPSRPNEPYEGFGEISFHGSPKRMDSGVGFYSDTNVVDMKSTTKKSVEFRRCVESEIQMMQEGDNKSISETVQKKLG